MKTSKIAALLIIILSLVTTQVDAVFSPVENYDMSNTQVAYISYIDETGSNIGTDKTNPAAIISNYQIQSSMIGEEVDIEGTIQDIDFNVQGNILTTNENRNVIIFDAKDNNNNYDVAYCALERDLENTLLFFKDYYQNSSDLQNVLKLYLQPINTNSLVMVEIFLTNDAVINFLENYEIPYDSKEANLHQSWFVKYYNAAIDYATLDLPQPQSNYSYVSRDYSKAYMVVGEYVKYVFKVGFYCDFDDPDIGKSTDASVYMAILDSRTTVPDNPNSSLVSSTQDVISIQSANVQFASSNNLALTDQTSLRQLTGTNRPLSVSISFGYSLGPAAVTASYDFNKNGKISSTFAFPHQTSNGQLTEAAWSTETGVMDSGWILNRKNHQYGMIIGLHDFGNSARSCTVKVHCDFRVVNDLHPRETTWDSYVNSYTARIS